MPVAIQKAIYTLPTQDRNSYFLQAAEASVTALRMQVILLFQILFWSKMLNYFWSLTCANYIYFHFLPPFVF